MYISTSSRSDVKRPIVVWDSYPKLKTLPYLRLNTMCSALSMAHPQHLHLFEAAVSYEHLAQMVISLTMFILATSTQALCKGIAVYHRRFNFW